MDEKKIEPTDAMVDEAANALCLNATGTSLSFQDYADKHTYRHRARVALRVVLNHPDAPGLFECDYTDYVHVDEAATRVEAAREQGWDDAAQHIYNKGWEGVTALRKANPHRPVRELPTEDGAVIVPAEGFEFIWVEGGRYFTRLTYSSQLRRWYGVAVNGGPAWASFWCGDPETITPGTWQVADQ